MRPSSAGAHPNPQVSQAAGSRLHAILMLFPPPEHLGPHPSSLWPPPSPLPPPFKTPISFLILFFFLEASLNFHITPWTERSSSVVPQWLYVILSSHNSLYSDVITFRICFENFEAKGRSYSCL